MEKNNKKVGIIITILNILCFLSFCFLTYSIYLINGVETEIRYIGIGVLLLLNIGILFLRKITKNKKLVKYIIYCLIIIVFTIVQGYLGYFVYKTYSSIDNINKSNITYSTSVVVLKDSKVIDISALKNKKIGIVVDETSIDGYIMANELLKEEGLIDDATIIEYESIIAMAKGLYENTIDAMITSGEYDTMLKSVEEFNKITEETRIIKEKEKKYTKEEIANITGDEMINYNTSDSVTDPFSVLVMGVDSTAETLSSNASGNGDALMLVTFNPKTLNATILSIPRDSYVYISCMGYENKITHAAWGGSSCMIKTIEKMTGININYYVKINFKGVVKLVDAIGGITVDVPKTLDGVCEQNSSRSAKRDVCLKSGTQLLNGEQALAMARHRKTLLTGDLERGKNQQLVVQGMLNQLKTIRSSSQALEILDALSKSMDTNFTTKQLLSFYDIAKTLFETSSSNNLINMQRLYLYGSSQMIYDERAGMVLYNYIPNKCSLNEDIDSMEKNLGKETAKITKKIDFDIEDTFAMKTIGENPSCGTTTYTLLPNVVGQKESSANTVLKKVGMTVNVEYKEIETGTFNVVISQSIPAYKRVDKISDKTITIVISKQKVVEEEPSSGDEQGGQTSTNPEIPTGGEQGGQTSTDPEIPTGGEQGGQTSTDTETPIDNE